MLSQEDIITLWQSEGDFRDIAATEMVRNFRQYAFLFFQLIQQDPEPLCAIAQNEMPFLREGFARPCAYKKHQSYLLFQEGYEQATAFFEELSRYLTRYPAETEKLTGELMKLFRGIGEDLQQQYHLPLPQVSDAVHRQLMVFVTGKCNLHCPYCFSANIEPHQIGLESLTQVFQWAAAQGVSSITPCGGEPLLYPYFQTFLELIRAYRMTTYFASNFTIDISRFHSFEADTVKGIYVHLTPEIFTNKKLQQTVIQNITIAKEREIELVGRANIVSTDEKTDHWISFLHQMGIKRLHVALTIPSAQATNLHIPYTQFQHYVPVIEALIHKADEKGIAIGFSKPVPLCIFPPETAHRLIHTGYEITSCDIYKDHYMHNLCLSPTLQFTPCLGLNHPQIPFSEALHWHELEEAYQPLVSGLMESPPYATCESCFLWKRRLCQGVCLSYKEKRIHPC